MHMYVRIILQQQQTLAQHKMLLFNIDLLFYKTIINYLVMFFIIKKNGNKMENTLDSAL